jgi:thymidylate synthase (FAD)
MTQLLDHGYLKVIETWGSDERIIESARMSTDKGFQGWDWRCSQCGLLKELPEGCAQFFGPNQAMCDHKWVEGDTKLLRYLYTNRHMTPFEMAGATIEVQAPIFVFREWHRHRTQSYNELSARYTELPDLFYMPSKSRLENGGQSSANKQASGVGLAAPVAERMGLEIVRAYERARDSYEWLLASGMSRELARIVIPVGQYSRMRASANLRNWLGFLELRMAPGAQFEIREYANALHTELTTRFPRTLALFDSK